MKKILIAILSVIMLVSVAATLTACGGSGKDVGIAMPTSDLQRWNQDGAALKKGFEDKNFTVELKYSNNVITTQINDVENMVTQGVKVLVISAIEGSSLGKVLAQAKAKGVVVIAYDRLLMNTPDVDYYTSFDNIKVGEAQGLFLEEKLGLKTLAAGASKNIEFVAGDPGDSNALKFYTGAMNILKPYLENGKLKCLSGQTEFTQVTTAGWSTATAQTRFETMIGSVGYNTTDKKLDAICASNDSTAAGATAAFKAVYTTAATFPLLTGQDCDKTNVKTMKDGFQAMSVFKDTRTLAAKTVELVLAVLDGKDEAALIADKKLNSSEYNNGNRLVWAHLSEVVTVTTANIKEMLIDSGYYKESDIA